MRKKLISIISIIVILIGLIPISSKARGRREGLHLQQRCCHVCLPRRPHSNQKGAYRQKEPGQESGNDLL